VEAKSTVGRLLAAGLLAGCNALLGIDEPREATPDAPPAFDARPPVFDARPPPVDARPIDAAPADAPRDATAVDATRLDAP
jgi:hypothetical protein